MKILLGWFSSKLNIIFEDILIFEWSMERKIEKEGVLVDLGFNFKCFNRYIIGDLGGEEREI